MTTVDFLKIIITVVLAGVLRPFFDKLITPIVPDHKQVGRFLRRIAQPLFAYVLPIGMITWEFLIDQPVSKAFILKLVIYLSLMTVNLILYFANDLAVRIKVLERKIT